MAHFGEFGGVKCILARWNKPMKSENQTVEWFNQPIKIEKPWRLAALVKEMIAPFPCPNHGGKRSKQRRKSKFVVFSTRGRSYRLIAECQYTPKNRPLGFVEVYSVAREAKNWISCDLYTASPTELNGIVQTFLPRWKQTRKQILRQVPWLLYELIFTVQLQDNLLQGR